MTPDPAPPSDAATRPVALVTGASEGIGLALAHELARRGRTLLLVARRREPLESAAATLRSTHGVAVTSLALDLTRGDALAEIDQELVRLGAHVEILVNNAAIGHCGAFSEAPPEGLDRLVALNVAVPGRLMRHVLPGMRSRRSGAILNVASLGAYVPGPYQAAYYASKSYLLSLSQAVAAEVRRDGITVTTIAPGPVETRFHDRMGAGGALYRRWLPSARPSSVARLAALGLDLGLRIAPVGFLSLFGGVALRLLPHSLLIPVVSAMLDPRVAHPGGARDDA